MMRMAVSEAKIARTSAYLMAKYFVAFSHVLWKKLSALQPCQGTGFVSLAWDGSRYNGVVRGKRGKRRG